MKRTFLSFPTTLTVQKNEHALTIRQKMSVCALVCHKIKFLNMLCYRTIRNTENTKKNRLFFHDSINVIGVCAHFFSFCLLLLSNQLFVLHQSVEFLFLPQNIYK